MMPHIALKRACQQELPCPPKKACTWLQQACMPVTAAERIITSYHQESMLNHYVEYCRRKPPLHQPRTQPLPRRATRSFSGNWKMHAPLWQRRNRAPLRRPTAAARHSLSGTLCGLNSQSYRFVPVLIGTRCMRVRVVVCKYSQTKSFVPSAAVLLFTVQAFFLDSQPNG